MGTEKGIKIAKLFGIDICLDSLWFLIFGLITFSLASGYFPQAVSGASQAEFWVAGVLTSIAFFGSVVFHELAHALMARNFGIQTKEIKLWLLGGVAQIEKDASSPKEEFLIGFSGPVSSMILAGLFWSFSYFGAGFLPAIVSVGLGYLALINLLLAGFNLIPGFPLDGGRVLRAALWAYMRNEAKANRLACLSGRGVGYLFMIAGFVFLLNGVFVQAVWFIIIGWFLNNAATSSQRFYEIQKKLTGVKIGQIVNAGFCRDVFRPGEFELLGPHSFSFCSVHDDAKEVRDKMLKTEKMVYLVYDGICIIALITLSELERYALKEKGAKT